ncbi:MAG: nucleotidyltransferase domain-containing protein [Thermodesulfovibrionales bacterium]
MFITEELELRDKVKKLRDFLGENLLYVVAFGSRVRGDFEWDSDLDVLVVINKRDLSIENEIRKIFYDDPFSPYSLIVMDNELYKRHEMLNTPFLNNIRRDGKVFYEHKG